MLNLLIVLLPYAKTQENRRFLAKSTESITLEGVESSNLVQEPEERPRPRPDDDGEFGGCDMDYHFEDDEDCFMPPDCHSEDEEWCGGPPPPDCHDMSANLVRISSTLIISLFVANIVL